MENCLQCAVRGGWQPTNIEKRKNVSGIILTPFRWWRDGEEIDRTL
jgi:hypothetical protein